MSFTISDVLLHHICNTRTYIQAKTCFTAAVSTFKSNWDVDTHSGPCLRAAFHDAGTCVMMLVFAIVNIRFCAACASALAQHDVFACNRLHAETVVVAVSLQSYSISYGCALMR
jgi:hypothetical protein